jgi:hypothetical protein
MGQEQVMSNPTNIPTPQTFQVEMMIDPVLFEKIMSDEKYKEHIKDRLAIDLAKHLLESARTTFTYSEDIDSDNYYVRAKIIL